jgi:Uma2 family endonuclease
MHIERRKVAVAEQEIPPLERGDKLSRDEFMRRWEAMPHLKRAELIGGIVYMPSPLSRSHGDFDSHVGAWLWMYSASTPGCEAGGNATWLMKEEDAPQPDCDLRILPEYGGQSRMEGEYSAGAPELLAEVCLSSTSYDLHQKYDLYEQAGVQEYVALLLREQEVRWHRLVDGKFQVISPGGDGILRSVAFPGLWLDPAVLLVKDKQRMLAVLQQGLQSPEHAVFVAELAKRKKD